MVERYYDILGISDRSGLSEIKRAFRTRAKELHPDVNKSPNAHQEFILLLEAYEYLLNRHTGKVYFQNSTTTIRYEDYKRWQDSEAARARHRAEYYARKRYQVFTDSEYYKNLTTLTTFLGHLEFFMAVAFLTVLPVYLTLTYDVTGFIIGIIAVIITSPITVGAINSRPPINIRNFFKSFLNLLQLLKTKTAIITFITILNVYLFFKVGFQTMIPFYMLLLIYGGGIGIVYFITKNLFSHKIRPTVFSFCSFPGMLNLIFALNYLFSGNPQIETYLFTHDKSWFKSKLQNTSYIFLENNNYENYPGIRVFVDFEAMKEARKITYQFENGFLGVRVMKDYKFSP